MVPFHDFNDFQSRSAGQGVAAEGTADDAGRDGFHDFFAGYDGAEGNAAADGFGRSDDVRRAAGFFPVFRSQHAARTAPAGLDFVGNEQDAVVVADFAQRFDPGDRSRDEAAFTLERFDDDGCDVFCRRGIHEDFLQGIHVKFQGFVIAQACRFAVEIRKFGTVYAVRERPHAAGVGFLSRHGHGHERAPVEGTGEDDDIRPFRISFGDFDGVFVGFGAAVDEEGPFLFTSDRGDGIELFRQGDIAFVGDDIGHGVEIVTGLVLDGLDDFRLGIADVQDADAADPVEEIVAVHVFEHSAFTAFDDRRIDGADGIGNGLTAAG